MTNTATLLPDYASEAVRERLNGSSYGSAATWGFKEPGDYLFGRVTGLTRAPSPYAGKPDVTVLVVRTLEGRESKRSPDTRIQEGDLRKVFCSTKALRELVEKFNPTEGDEIVLLYRGVGEIPPTGGRPPHLFTFNVQKGEVQPTW